MIKMPIALKVITPAILLCAMAFQCFYFASANGQTSDEPFYLSLGYSGLTQHDYSYLTEHPPLMPQLGALALLPLKPNFPVDDRVFLEDGRTPDTGRTGLKFLYEKGNDPARILFYARVPIIITTLLLGTLIALWSYELFGLFGMLISTTLYAFCPNMISHGSLYTTDSGVAVFYFGTFYLLYKYFKNSQWRWLVMASLFSGLCVGAKMSGFIIIPSTAVVLLLFLRYRTVHDDPIKNLSNDTPRWFEVQSWILLILSLGHKVSLSLIAPPCFIILSQSKWFKSKPKLSILMSFILSLICLIGLPRLYMKGSHALALGLTLWVLSWALAHALLFRSKDLSYYKILRTFALICLGIFTVQMFVYLDLISTLPRFKVFNHLILALKNSLSHAAGSHQVCVEGSWISCDYRYFTQVMLIKTPVTALFFSVLGMVVLHFTSLSRFHKTILWLPPLIFLLVASFANKINIGLRHVLPIYPFLYLLSGTVGLWITKLNHRGTKTALYLLASFALIYYSYSSSANSPHHLSYFNEWIVSADEGAKLTADSNVIWGQDNRRLAMWAAKNKIPVITIGTKFQNSSEFDYYKMVWKPIQKNDFLKPASGYYALDVEAQALLPEDSPFKTLKPIAKAGKTFSIFQIT